MPLLEKAFEDLPPVARHSLTLIIFGVALATCYFTFDARVSAAASAANEAKQSAALMVKQLDDISRRNDVRANLIEARIVKGNIIAMWTRLCEAQRGGNRLAANILYDVIGGLRDEYKLLTNGGDFQPGVCP
jgi:hypothetical protein